MNVVVSTALVPALFKMPFTASLSVALRVTEKAVELLAITAAVVNV